MSIEVEIKQPSIEVEIVNIPVVAPIIQRKVPKTYLVTSQYPLDDGSLQLGFDLLSKPSETDKRLFSTTVTNRFAVYDWSGRVGDRYIVVDTWYLQFDPVTGEFGNMCYLNNRDALNPDGTVAAGDFSLSAAFFTMMDTFVLPANNNFTGLFDWHPINEAEVTDLMQLMASDYINASIKSIIFANFDSITIAGTRIRASTFETLSPTRWVTIIIVSGNRQIINDLSGFFTVEGFNLMSRIAKVGDFPTVLNDTLNGFTRIV